MNILRVEQTYHLGVVGGRQLVMVLAAREAAKSVCLGSIRDDTNQIVNSGTQARARMMID